MLSRTRTRCPPSSGLGFSFLSTQHDTSFAHNTTRHSHTLAGPSLTRFAHHQILLLYLIFFLSLSLLPCPSLRENGRVYWLIISAFSFTFQIFFFQSLQIGPLPPATLISALLLATPMDEIFSHDSSDPTHTHIQGLPPAPPSLPGLYSPPNRGTQDTASSVLTSKTHWPLGVSQKPQLGDPPVPPLVTAGQSLVEAAQCTE